MINANGEDASGGIVLTTAASNSSTSTCNAADGGGSTPTSASSLSKEKRSWFHSLTHRKKSHSQSSLTAATLVPAEPVTEEITRATTPSPSPSHNDNNNEPLQQSLPQDETNTLASMDVGGLAANRKRKEDKSIFQRLRQKMGLRFHSIRQRRQLATHDDADSHGATTDASSEFFTRSGVPAASHPLTFNFADSVALPLEEAEEVQPFTHDYKRFIVKKWREGEAGPNRVMFMACSEMLSQVWYWGEISRRDAQKVLTGKPSGSFLVRDSESSGCQFTLSFRICNVTLHYRLEHRNNYWHFEELQYESIVEMVEDILTRCTKNNFICFVSVPNEMQPQFPVILKYPLSRYMVMPPLQDLCRRMIQRHVTPSEIAKLPVPPQLLEYLSEQRELVF